MQLLNEYFEHLKAIRQGQQPLDAYLFAPVTAADGGRYDAHEAKRYRLLLALQCSREAGDEALLVPLLQAYDIPTKEPIYLIYTHRKNLSPRIRVFRDFLEQKLKASPWD